MAAADKVTGNDVAGQLPNRSIVAGTVLFTLSGAGNNVEDDGNGILVDEGTTDVRGSIDYETGVYSFTASGTPDNVTVAYDHTDFVSVAASDTTTEDTGGATGSAVSFVHGVPIAPGSYVSADAGSITVKDDGKGNIVQDNTAAHAVVGTIDYNTGAVAYTVTGTINASNMDATFRRDVLSKELSAGGGALHLETLPEQGSAYAAAISGPSNQETGGDGEVELGLFAETTDQTDGAVLFTVNHMGDDTFINSDFNTEVGPLNDAGKDGLTL